MSHKRYSILVGLFLVVTFLAACTRPIGNGPTAIPSVAYTQAVQTVVAKLTVTPVAINPANRLPHNGYDQGG